MIRPTVTDKGQVPLPTTRTWTRLDPTLSTAARATPDSRSRHSSQTGRRSEEHTSELQSLMRISYAVFCLKKKKQKRKIYSYYKDIRITQIKLVQQLHIYKI